MSHPKTLLQMAGAPSAPSSLSAAALVVIDAQQEYLSGALPLEAMDPALDALAALLVKARAAGTPIFHIAHAGRPGSLFDRSASGGAIIPQAAPVENNDGGIVEPVIEKTLPNSFAGTDLAKAVADTGRQDLILAGFMTHMCVSSTARAALDLGYRVTIAADATATRALPDPTGGEALPAAAVQRAALAALADRFAVVAPVAAIQ